jgi:hypothetical protein
MFAAMSRRLMMLALGLLSSAVLAQPCKVLDPELQERYFGPCVNGLAEGVGEARGIARYEGGFRAGMKHGRGVKVWPNGDRYEGEFVDGRREGQGVYSWGRGRWAGERYEGAYVNDRRHGFGVYRWPGGDVYAGPWQDDRPVGPPTEMMLARATFEREARAAVAKEGQKVCRRLPIGIGDGEWVRGMVVAFNEELVAVRIDEPGQHPHEIAGVALRAGEVLWDAPTDWTPCY